MVPPPPPLAPPHAGQRAFDDTWRAAAGCRCRCRGRSRRRRRWPLLSTSMIAVRATCTLAVSLLTSHLAAAAVAGGGGEQAVDGRVGRRRRWSPTRRCSRARPSRASAEPLSTMLPLFEVISTSPPSPSGPPPAAVIDAAARVLRMSPSAVMVMQPPAPPPVSSPPVRPVADTRPSTVMSPWSTPSPCGDVERAAEAAGDGGVDLQASRIADRDVAGARCARRLRCRSSRRRRRSRRSYR